MGRSWYVHDFLSAKEALQSARNVYDGKPIGNNTRLMPALATVGDEQFKAIAVQLHHTYVVTYLENGWIILDTGGWNTVTTWQRIREFGPRNVSKDHVGSPIGYGPPKVQKCRVCHGSGEIRHVEENEYWFHEGGKTEWFPKRKEGRCPDNVIEDYGHIDAEGNVVEDWWRLEDQDSLRYEVIGTHLGPCPWNGHPRKLPEAKVWFEECHNCRGSGKRDHGSKPIYVPFEGGVVVDGTGEWVADSSFVWFSAWLDPKILKEQQEELRKAVAEAGHSLPKIANLLGKEHESVAYAS